MEAIRQILLIIASIYVSIYLIFMGAIGTAHVFRDLFPSLDEQYTRLILSINMPIYWWTSALAVTIWGYVI